MQPKYSTIFLICCMSGILISSSCTKDSKKFPVSSCVSCGRSDTSHLNKETTIIEDSVWERQGTGIFKSDITSELQDAGITVNQVYALYIIRDGNTYQIFPYRQVNYMSGVIFASVFSSGDGQACTIMYSDTNQESHYGESPRGGHLPFRSISIQVLFLK
jgi:hypothetical protein